MNSLDEIRAKIKDLYDTNPNIHVNVSTTGPKISLTDVPVVITGVYPHIFQVEEQESGKAKSYTLQYSDVLTKHIEIIELGD